MAHRNLELDCNSRALNHFLDLAAGGKYRGCSGGEARARRLAKAILDDVPGLDGEAVEGLHHFLNICSLKPSLAVDLLDLSGKEPRP